MTKFAFKRVSGGHQGFATRLSVNGTVLDRVKESKILGLWISDTLSWSRQCTEICKEVYSRLAMTTRLKYVGVSIEDLFDILHIIYHKCYRISLRGVPFQTNRGKVIKLSEFRKHVEK